VVGTALPAEGPMGREPSSKPRTSSETLGASRAVRRCVTHEPAGRISRRWHSVAHPFGSEALAADPGAQHYPGPDARAGRDGRCLDLRPETGAS